MPIHAVILDYGNVLCPMPQPSDYEELRRLTGLEEQAFHDAFWRYRLDYDRGTLDGTAYWRRIAQAGGNHFPDAQIQELIAADIALWNRPDPVLLDWGRHLHNVGVKTAVLSNMPRDLALYLRQNAAWLRAFDHAVFSAELGLLKPQAGIYVACLHGLKVPAEKALFIDDNLANVEGARALGMHAVRFESVSKLEVEVRRFDLPTPSLEDSSSSVPSRVD
jgi:putative hydrolase of the HAD superfamily